MYLAIDRMQNKTTLTFYFARIRVAKITKANGDKCWWGCGKGEHILLVGLQTGTVTMEIDFDKPFYHEA